MPSKPSVIKCPKCGYLPNILGDICLKCGARLEKTCGECGFGNQVERNYCEGCGALMALNAPPRNTPAPDRPENDRAQKVEMESIQDTVDGKARSFREHPDERPEPVRTPEQAARAKTPQDASPRDLSYGSSPFIADSARLHKDKPSPVTRQPDNIRRFFGPAITILLALVLGGILYRIAAPSIPRMRLLMTAKTYLTNISQGKYEKAYELLSSNSKAAYSLEDYLKNSRGYYAKAPAWQFRDIQVFTMDKNAAMVRYQLKEGTAEWKPDYISFVREQNRWVRPYIWGLFEPINEALKRQDFPQALFLAQKLYLTDPIDPRSSGFLCSAEFYMGLYDKAAESCRRAIDGAAVYPVGYSDEDLYWFNFYYAESLRHMQRDSEALLEYEKLMKWPGLTAKEQCPLFLSRADSYIQTSDYPRALQDVMSAEGACFENPEKDEAKKRLAQISGAAGAEAVAFAQNSRFQAGMPPIAEARKRQLETMKGQLGPQNAKFLPKDQWLAVHVTGPEYKVFLRQEALDPRTRRKETKDVFVFHVNLWTGKARVENDAAQAAAAENGQP